MLQFTQNLLPMTLDLVLERVISGGQTGVDQLGLAVALALGFSTGGVAPKGFLTEYGPDERLRGFGLIENATADHPARALANVTESDGTVIFGAAWGGTLLTLLACHDAGKPHRRFCRISG